MDILYLLGNGSKWNNNELRFSLRSIAYYGDNIRKVYVCGDDPGFLSKEVTYIPCKDIYDAKHKNMLYKIQYAIENSDIADEFLVSSDDHFYIKRTDFDKYPYYRKDYVRRKCRTQLPLEVEPGTKSPGYTKQLIETRKFLDSHGLPHHGFMIHANTHFNKKYFLEMMDLVKESYDTELGVEPTCLMLNYQYSKEPFNYVDRIDSKIDRKLTVARFSERIRRYESFSVSDRSLTPDIKCYLRKIYPVKCKYEI